MNKRVRLQCTTTPQIAEAVERLLWNGTHGKTRSEVVERLLCEAVRVKIDKGELKATDIHEHIPEGWLIEFNPRSIL